MRGNVTIVSGRADKASRQRRFHCGGDRIVGCRRMEDTVDDQMLVAHSQSRQLPAAPCSFGQCGWFGTTDKDQCCQFPSDRASMVA